MVRAITLYLKGGQFKSQLMALIIMRNESTIALPKVVGFLRVFQFAPIWELIESLRINAVRNVVLLSIIRFFMIPCVKPWISYIYGYN